MTNSTPCPLFAYYVEGRKRWAPWTTESTTVLAPDAYSATMIAADHQNLKGCKITSVFRR